MSSSRRRGSEEIDGLGEPILLREILIKCSWRSMAFFVRGRDQKKKKKKNDDDDDDDEK